MARVVSEVVLIEDVGDRELTDGHGDGVCRPRPAHLVGGVVDLIRLAAEIEGLAEEQSLQSEVGRRLADLVGFAAREAGDAERVAQPEALVDLGVRP